MTAVPIGQMALTPDSEIKVTLPSGSYADCTVAQLFSQGQKTEVKVVANTDSVTPSDATSYYILNPANTIAGATVTMPANPYDGQEFAMMTTHTVTSLTHQANAGQTLNGALTTITAGTHGGSWKWNAALATWLAF